MSARRESSRFGAPSLSTEARESRGAALAAAVVDKERRESRGRGRERKGVFSTAAASNVPSSSRSASRSVVNTQPTYLSTAQPVEEKRAYYKPLPSGMDYETIRQLITSRLRDTYKLNLNQDVKSYKDIVGRRIMPYRVRRVVNPYEFYLEFTNVPESRVYSTWFNKMQEFYEEASNQEKFKVFKDTPLPGRCYVCKDPIDGKWHRVRLHEIEVKASRKILLVYYLDLCKLQETMQSYLLELHPTFAESPAQVFRCYLHDVEPLNGNDDSLTWSPDACRYFQEAVKNKEFTGIVLVRSDEVVTKGMPDVLSSLGMVLVMNLPGTRHPDPEACTLNAQMVDAKFGVATGVYASCRHTLEIENCIPSFGQLEFNQVFFPRASSAPKQAASNPSFLFEYQEYLVETLKSSSNIKTNLSLNSPVSMSQFMEDAEMEAARAYSERNMTHLPKEILCRLADIEVVYVNSPSWLIVHLKSKKKQLVGMQEAIGRLVATEDPLRNGKPGMFVACHVLDRRSKSEEESLWCRGIICSVPLDIEGQRQYKVLLVDLGNSVEIASAFVRRLPDYFTQIPSFAIRVHMAAENFTPDGCPGTGWSMKACAEFRRYTTVQADFKPTYISFCPRGAGPLQLNHFTHQIIYNVRDDKWDTAAQVRPPTSYRAADNLKNHPMLRSLYVSFGVDIHYEVACPHGHFWYFAPILESLIREKLIKEGTCTKNCLQRHLEIVDNSTTFQVDHSSVHAARKSLK